MLEAAAARFDVFITVDRVISGQPPGFLPALAVITLVAPSNRLGDLIVLIPKIHEALEEIRPGQVIRVAHE